MHVIVTPALAIAKLFAQHLIPKVECIRSRK